MPDRARMAAARTMLPSQAGEISAVATPSVGISQVQRLSMSVAKLKLHMCLPGCRPRSKPVCHSEGRRSADACRSPVFRFRIKQLWSGCTKGDIWKRYLPQRDSAWVSSRGRQRLAHVVGVVWCCTQSSGYNTTLPGALETGVASMNVTQPANRSPLCGITHFRYCRSSSQE